MEYDTTVNEALNAEPPGVEFTLAQGLLARFHGDLVALRSQQENTVEVEGLTFPPAESGPMSLDEQAEYLSHRTDRLRVDTVVRAAARIGARRLDEVRVQQGLEPLHESLIDSILASDEAQTVFEAGNADLITSQGRGLNYISRDVVETVERHVDPALNNPVLVSEASGGGPRMKAHFLSQSLLGVLKSEQWPPKLRALLYAVGMHQTAIRTARGLLTPLIQKDLPAVQDGKEALYWRSRLLGNEQQHGALYYLGYLQKSRPLLRGYMKDQWGDAYYDNRQIFTAAVTMRANVFPLKTRTDEMRIRRRPVFHLIKEGYFGAAKEHLQQYARETPELFSWIGLDYLLGE